MARLGGQPEAQQRPHGAHRCQGHLEVGRRVPITKTTGNGVRNMLADFDPTEASVFIDRPSLQFAMGKVLSGMQEPQVKRLPLLP